MYYYGSLPILYHYSYSRNDNFSSMWIHTVINGLYFLDQLMNNGYNTLESTNVLFSSTHMVLTIQDSYTID